MQATSAMLDFDRSPLLVFYELTRACDLACRHCRATARPDADPQQLDTATARALLNRLAEFDRPPMVVFTGGDPLKRADLLELIDHARDAGLRPSVAPSPTPLLTADAVEAMKRAGVASISISVDGPEAASHDRLRGFGGTFDRAVQALGWARRVGLSTQVNTVVTPENHDRLEPLADRLAGLGIARWSLFFLVPVGRGRTLGRLTPAQYDVAFDLLLRRGPDLPFAVKTTEAPFYRRRLLQNGQQLGGGRNPMAGINDGKGVMFVSHVGELCPSGFLPLVCGRFPADDPVEVYRGQRDFVRLRDPRLLRGKCGACGFKAVCGGSRARAFAVTGDYLAAEPDCGFLPMQGTTCSA
jgi:MoaA/NifB/PqqE/SkfB family radical SAM enzyme